MDPLSFIRSESFFQGKQVKSDIPKFMDGELITGKILRLLPNDTALLQIGQRTLTARLETPVHALGEYWFQTIVSTQGIKLKVLPRQEKANASLLEQIISLYRLPPGKYTEALVQTLMKENIPFTKEQIIEAATWFNHYVRNVRLPDSLEAVQHSIVLAIKRKWPLSDGVLRTLLAIYQNTSFKEELKQLLNELQSRQQLQPAALQLKNVLMNLLTEQNALIKHDSTAFNLEQGTIGFSSPSGEKGDQSYLRITDNIITFLKQIPLMLGLRFERLFIHRDIQQLKELSKFALKPLLLASYHEVQDSVLKEKIGEVLFRLQAQTIAAHEQGLVGQYFFEWPLRMDHYLTDFSLNIYGKKREDGQIDPKYCRIVFDLRLPNLKDTIVDIWIQNKVMKVNIYNDALAEKNINPHIQMLKERLNQDEYYLSSVSVKPFQQQKIMQNIQEMIEQTSYQRVDLKI
ncbi:hypothetical protein [Bacillus alveayuensis]|uniref:hypothetical protein n=1 Tax=Aeribacillus alveayuensis TaxID=279215 RepID=UPI0005D1057A|nr:hypothetical protein [Bacillus alveayuensis]